MLAKQLEFIRDKRREVIETGVPVVIAVQLPGTKKLLSVINMNKEHDDTVIKVIK